MSPYKILYCDGSVFAGCKKLSSKAKECYATPPTQEDFDAVVCDEYSNIVLQAEVQRLIPLKADALLVHFQQPRCFTPVLLIE